MAQYTIQISSREQENLLQDFLNNLRINFTKSEQNEDDFVFTDEMKRVCDEALSEDPETFQDAFEALNEISEKYGV